MSIRHGSTVDAIDVVPILSRGRHRRPAQGACLMEFASYLAGERWSDHPACTHPLLAGLARQVNDRISDTHRQRLVELVTEIIGVTVADPRVGLRMDATVALSAAGAAFPVATGERRLVLAAAIVNVERVLAELDGTERPAIGPRGRAALAAVTAARRLAGHGEALTRGGRRVFARQTAPAIVQCAVDAVAHPGVDDRDDRLVDMLATAIRDARRLLAVEAMPVHVEAPRPCVTVR